MRPDAIPARPLGSRAVLPPDALAALFGAGAVLRPSATVEVVRLGEVVARVAVESGPALALRLDSTDAAPADGLSVRGPVGAMPVGAPACVRSRLVLPDGLRRAWNVPDRATVAAGAVAVTVPVASGPEPLVELDRALWLGAGRPDVARWLPGLDLAPEPDEPEADARETVVERRVVTETDVRQARLHRRRIRLTPGQIVTPAARSLAREWDVFEEPGGGRS